MKNLKYILPLILVLTTFACSPNNAGVEPVSDSPEPASTSTGISSISSPQGAETLTPIPATFTPIPTLTFTLTPVQTPTQTPIPTVESLKAKVIAEKLSCRYGPGAEYLYLFAFNGNANIKLVGRTDANNWVWVENTNRCWVNTKFLEIQGDPRSLPIVYPGLKLPVSPYYPGPTWAKAARDGNSVEITWEAVLISPGKYADEFMHQYIIEVWRCEAGEIIFETLGTNYPAIKVENDEPGCAVPSHGLVYVQEKHGYGGPVEIPWPPHK
ncbi:MAG TPA: hypothetical protein VLT51_12035 [Anaerolineales bacterium]|nr:hypothetical protein [Anaerolineales bacterium]